MAEATIAAAARTAARLFRDRAACGAALVTRGDQGMWLCAAGIAVGKFGPAVVTQAALLEAVRASDS